MKSLLIIIFVFVVSSSWATCTLIVDGGDWSDAASWDCAGGPANSETMIIPAGMTVVININTPAYTGMTIELYGTMDFDGGSKINMAADGVINVYTGGEVSGGNGGSKVVIDGVAMWDGNDDPVFGPTSVTVNGWLPVELLDFNAIANENKVEITWTTASEINNNYFLVERSEDGYDWEVVIEVKGAGSSSSIINYFEVDNEPLMGLSYYRLTQVDFNGKQTTFNIVPVEILASNNGSMSVYPNPANKGERINVAFENLDCNGHHEILVVLRDIYGKEVYSKVELVNCREGLVAIDRTHHLASGTYLVIASSENLIFSQKIIIK